MERHTSWKQECQLELVILNEVKNLAATDYLDIVQTQRVHDRDEILRVAQNDKAERALFCPTI
jgi:hypothetical protein